MFGIAKRHPVARTPTRSEQVRSLWIEFEVWHAARLEEIENKIQAALKDLDTKWRPTKSRRTKKDPKELEEEKTKARLELEKTLDGNAVRQEWDKRLRGAGLQSEDWSDMTDEEQRKVEMILGADLEPEEQHPHFSEAYAVVDPNSFHSPDDAWLEVKHTLRSDDQMSLDASTPSSSTSDAWSAPAYASWSSEASRSSQSSQTSSPEWHSTMHLASDASSSSSRLSNSASSSQFRSKSHGHYIGPHLTADTDDEEASFEKWKVLIRIQKIREFHDEAAAADIQLTLDLDEARRKKTWTKEDEAQRVRAHEADMLALRERKESERKATVDNERRKRRAELKQQLPADFDTAAQKVLKNLQLERDPVAAPDTPTIRQSAFVRTQKQSLQHLHQPEWPESGNDTPTPTTRSSGWSFKKDKGVSGSGAAFSEVPTLKRLATAPAAASILKGAPTVEPPQTKKPSTTAASAPSPPVVPIATPATAPSSSSSKKSKKEKGKAEKKTDVAAMEKIETSDDAKLDLPTINMPGQWGWGEDSSSSFIEALGTSAHSFSSSFAPSTSATSVPSSFSHYSSPLTAYPPGPSIPASSIPASTNIVPPAPQPHAQVPDNRRVWLPPSALEANLNNKSGKGKYPTAATLEVPPQIQKAVSGPNAASVPATRTANDTLQVPAPGHIQKSASGPPELGLRAPSSAFPPTTSTIVPAAAVGDTADQGSRGVFESLDRIVNHSKVAEPSASKPKSSSTKPSAPAVPVAPKLTPSLSSSSSSSKKKSKGKKKVTIEEAQDEDSSLDADELKGKGIERLPIDSRYIIEPIAESEPMAPKPTVAQETFRDIFDYGAGDVPASTSIPPAASTAWNDMHQPSSYDVWTPSAPQVAPSASLSNHDHDRWIPGGMHEPMTKHEKQEKKVRWTPSAYTYDAPEPQDVFLSALDSLEAIVRGGSGGDSAHKAQDGASHPVAGKREANGKKAPGRVRDNNNTDENFWQHAITSLGGRAGSNSSGPSAL